MSIRHAHQNNPLQNTILVVLVYTLLAACSNPSATDPAEAQQPLADPTSIDVSNDILIPPTLDSTRPNPPRLTVGTDVPTAIVSNGKPAQDTFDMLGHSLATDARGTTLATGMPGHDHEALQDTGAVLVEFRVEEQWWFDTLLTSDAATDNAQLGYATAISEDGLTIAAGAPHDKRHGRSAGAVFIFERFGEGWQSTAELYSPSPLPDARFGHVIALQPDGNTLYVTENRPQGHVHIFQRISSQWQYTQTLTKPAETNGNPDVVIQEDLADGFGMALSAAANGTLAVSAGQQKHYADGKLSTGQVLLYRSENLSTQYWRSLNPPGLSTAHDLPLQHFGSAIALSADGSTLIVSGIEQPLRFDRDVPAFDSALQKSLAQALVYELTEDQQWVQSSTLIPAGSHAGDSEMDVVVSANGQRILIGLSNRYWQDNQVSVMTRTTDTWTLTARLLSPENEAKTFAESIAMAADGSRVLVTATDIKGGRVYQWLPQ